MKYGRTNNGKLFDGSGVFPLAGSRYGITSTWASEVEKRGLYDGIKIPNMEKTFGNLEYAGEGKVEQRRINGRMTTLSWSYNLYSVIQCADDVEVILHKKQEKNSLNMRKK